jgi:hypothetical protein
MRWEGVTGGVGQLRSAVSACWSHLGCSAQPVTVGAEDQCVDDVSCVQAVQALALGQVPQHGNTVLRLSCVVVR